MARGPFPDEHDLPILIEIVEALAQKAAADAVGTPDEEGMRTISECAGILHRRSLGETT